MVRSKRLYRFFIFAVSLSGLFSIIYIFIFLLPESLYLRSLPVFVLLYGIHLELRDSKFSTYKGLSVSCFFRSLPTFGREVSESCCLKGSTVLSSPTFQAVVGVSDSPQAAFHLPAVMKILPFRQWTQISESRSRSPEVPSGTSEKLVISCLFLSVF
jgi:hypothetical protein